MQMQEKFNRVRRHLCKFSYLFTDELKKYIQEKKKKAEPNPKKIPKCNEDSPIKKKEGEHITENPQRGELNSPKTTDGTTVASTSFSGHASRHSGSGNNNIPKGGLKIANLKPGQNNGRLVFKLTHKFPPPENENIPFKFLLADHSGRIQAIAWKNQEGKEICDFMEVWKLLPYWQIYGKNTI